MGLFHPKGSIHLTPSHVGARSEQHITTKLMVAGYEVLKPIRSGLRYDLVIEDAEGHFWRIQCKTGRYRNGAVEFNCRSNHDTHSNVRGTSTRSYRGECDYFAVYCTDLGKVYLVPTDQLPLQLACLRIDPPSGKMKSQGRGIRWAKDYEL
jgi:hypothetical protein